MSARPQNGRLRGEWLPPGAGRTYARPEHEAAFSEALHALAEGKPFGPVTWELLRRYEAIETRYL